MKARATQNASVNFNRKTVGDWEYRKGILLAIGMPSSMTILNCRGIGFRIKLISLSLRAKVSSISPAGTWGFGLWNDPFGLSLGFGGSPFRLPALPNAVWFFYASPQNYLSFTDDKPAQGFLAQTFRSPKFHPLLIPAGLALPFSRGAARKLLSKVIDEDSVTVSVDVTQWHRYKLEWNLTRVLCYVDDALVFELPVSPNPPLGVIIWIDNQYAAFTPEGKIAFGVLAGEEEWLEVEDIVISEGVKK